MINGNHGPNIFGEAEKKASEGGSALIDLNKKHAVIGDIGGKCLVLSWVQSHFDPAVQVASFQSFKSFSERYAHQYVEITKKRRRGKSEEEVKEPVQLGSQWLKWTKRRTYQGIDLVPGGPEVSAEGYLNLWRGFGCEAKAGDWSLMKRHIREVLAAGDDVAAVYIMKFAAWAVQNPDKRAEVALVFRGGKGSGKGTFANALKDIFGAHGLQIFSPKHLVGNFNAHLRSCVLLFADEAFWAGDKAGESALKGLITEPTLFIEQKGVDATAWKNRLHVIMAANADWVVPATQGERRYAAFDVSDCRMGDPAWFKALHEQMATGGREAMLHDLLAVDLTGWHPRQIPHTEALRQQKIHSMPPLWEWWEDVLQRGRLPHVDKNPAQAAAANLLDSAKQHNEKLKSVTSTALGRFLKTTGAYRVPRNYGIDWRFPVLDNARALFEKAWGKWEWHENEPKTPDWLEKPTTHKQTHNC